MLQRRQSRCTSRRAFTLVELLIVIAAMGVIAGMIVPQVESALEEAVLSAMLNDQQGLTSAIERYRLEHDGEPPEIVNNDLPQLKGMTDSYGTISKNPEAIYGPYLRDGIPVNPLNGSNQVYYSASVPPTNLSQRIGWAYHEETGQLWGGLSRKFSPGK